MRSLLVALYLASILLTIASYFMLPDQVAIHFGWGGKPDSWASKEFNTVIFLIMYSVVFLVFYYAPKLKIGLQKRFLNIPNKNYWMREENQQKLIEILHSNLSEFGVATLAFFFLVGLFTLDANLKDPIRLNEQWFLVVFVTFMAYVAYWTIKFFVALRIPKTNKRAVD